jgi:chemotaxis family two-component system response regulator Rcp1
MSDEQSNRITITLVEDNPSDVRLVQEALRHHSIDFEMLLLRDGEEALAYAHRLFHGIEKEWPDILMLDLNLPKVSGLEVLRFLRDGVSAKRTRIVVVTSSDSWRDRKQAAALEADYYFKKPPGFNEFLELGRVVKELAGAGTDTGSA